MNQTLSRPASNPAQAYEDYFVPGMFRPWAELLLDRAAPRPGERVLDVACGTGVVARLVAERSTGQSRVVGLDFSPAMLEVARSAAARDGVEIEWREGGAEALPFPDASFDLVLVQQGLQFFRDKAAATADLLRVLVPGGRAATATWAEIAANPFNEAFAQAIERHLGVPAMHTPFALGDRDALASLFADAGFGAVEIERARRTVRLPAPDRFVEIGLAGTAAAVPALQTMDDAARAALAEALRADLAPTLRAYTEGDELVFPMEAHILLARKPA